VREKIWGSGLRKVDGMGCVRVGERGVGGSYLYREIECHFDVDCKRMLT
jgi:hypothetical protein